LKEAVQRESTISGGLHYGERCCWSRVLDRESRMYVLIEAVQEKVQYLEVSTSLKDVVERSCAKRKYNIWRSLLCSKMLLKLGSG
jgi:hypothetical protein